MDHNFNACDRVCVVVGVSKQDADTQADCLFWEMCPKCRKTQNPYWSKNDDISRVCSNCYNEYK